MLEGWIPKDGSRDAQCCKWSSAGGMVGFECEGGEIDGGKEAGADGVGFVVGGGAAQANVAEVER
eukprot:8327823-Ditylum_brightwellii.AAC.1